MTRGELGKLLQARQTEVIALRHSLHQLPVDTKLLLLAIQKTAGFESLLSRRFSGVTLKTSEAVTGGVTSDAVTLENLSLDPASPLTVHTYQTVNLAPFKEIISQCFEPYLHIYLEAQDRNLAEMVARFATEAAAGTGTSDPGAVSAVLPSCGDLFVFYRACLVQCSELSTGQPMLDLAALFKKYLREYTSRVLVSSLPRVLSCVLGYCQN